MMKNISFDLKIVISLPNCFLLKFYIYEKSLQNNSIRFTCSIRKFNDNVLFTID